MDIELALADCLEKLERGEATLEEALGAYPELRAELQPLLALGQELRSIPKPTAPERLRGSRRPVFADRSRVAGPRWLAWEMGRVLLRPTPFARLAAGLAAATLLMGGTMVASAGSLPAEPLYPVKLAVEGVQLALTPDPQRRAEMEMQFADRRLAEVEAAAQQGKLEAVQQGLALYEERVESALGQTQAEPETATTLRESLSRQQEVLSRVYTKLPAAAQPAVLHAMEASKRGTSPGDEKEDGAPKAKGTPRPVPASEGSDQAGATPPGKPDPAEVRGSSRGESRRAAPTATPQEKQPSEGVSGERGKEQKKQDRRVVDAPTGAPPEGRGLPEETNARGRGNAGEGKVEEARAPERESAGVAEPTPQPTAASPTEQPRRDVKERDSGRGNRQSEDSRAEDGPDGKGAKDDAGRSANSRGGRR